MSDYIKKEDVLKLIDTGCLISNSNYNKEIKLINELPSVDVVEVRHGHWKILRPRSLRLDRRDSLFECSECGANRIRRTGEILNYCPNCGARMDRGEQEHE